LPFGVESSILLFADSLVCSLKGSPLMADSWRGFLGLACCSVFVWLVFEAYNLRLRNWTHVRFPPFTVECLVMYEFLRGLGGWVYGA
jgi:hypothetical protein